MDMVSRVLLSKDFCARMIIRSRISLKVELFVIEPLASSDTLTAPAALHSFHKLIYCCVGLAAGVRIIAVVA